MAARQPDIGVWGPTGAGKTTYLAGLLLALNKYAPEWVIWPVDGDTNAKKFIEEDAAGITTGHFPAPNPREKPIMYTFQLRREDTFLGTNGRYHEIAVIDAAGELIVDSSDPVGYFETLRKCKGILCMIDPEVSRSSGQPSPSSTTVPYFSLINRLAHQLQQEDGLTSAGKLKINLAFCITKIDLDDHWAFRNQPEVYLRTILGDMTYNRIMNICDPKRTGFFTTSIVGRYQIPGGESRPNIEPAGDHFRIANNSQWSPFRPLDPMFWLFDRIEEMRDAKLLWPRRILRKMVRQPNLRI